MRIRSRVVCLVTAVLLIGFACRGEMELSPTGCDCGPDGTAHCDQFGMVFIDGVCVAGYQNVGATWNDAVDACKEIGGDLCSASQYMIIRRTGQSAANVDLFHQDSPVWTRAFSDNDGGRLTSVLFSADNPNVTSSYYSFACCLDATPEPYLSNALLVPAQGSSSGGVKVTYLHTLEDTRAEAAMAVCSALRSDLCSKSQYVILNDADLFPSAALRRLTNEISDNDGSMWSPIVGSNTLDNPSLVGPWSYACCASQRPCDSSCPSPGTVVDNLCVVEMHSVEDTNFYTAARACAQYGADVCSNSQMQVLRDAGHFDGIRAWTNDGADNDGGGVGGLLPSMADNPNPETTLYGYACCL